MNHKKLIGLIGALLLLLACNLGKGSVTPTPSAASPATSSGPGVAILNPQDGMQVNGAEPLVVSFSFSGGPFLEADLQIDGQPVSQVTFDSTAASGQSTLTWPAPISGAHTLLVQLVSFEKQVYTDSVSITVSGGTQAPSETAPSPIATDPGMESVRQQVIQIMRDSYNINITAPPLARKSRSGVSTDPWDSVMFVRDWEFEIEIFPDGTVVRRANPIGHADDSSPYMSPGEKAIPVCRPAGTIRFLVAVVDYQNLRLTTTDTTNSVASAMQRINQEFLNYAVQAGANSPFLTLQYDTVHLSPPTDYLLTPALIQAQTGVDPSQYDLILQLDMDVKATYRQTLAAQNFDTFGINLAGCGGLPQNVSIWISLETRDQALGQDLDRRFIETLTHELLHTFGYPFEHTWPCGNGSAPDAADQCSLINWPTVMLGWTDVDGDGVAEIVDSTPYGLTP